MRGRIQERTRNFGHLVHETWPRTCMRSVFKFYKKQTKSENHETYWDVVISYVEAMIKISEDFVHVVTYDAYKPGHVYMCHTWGSLHFHSWHPGSHSASIQHPCLPSWHISSRLRLSTEHIPTQFICNHAWYWVYNHVPNQLHPYSWHSAKTPFVECHALALGKVFFCFWPINFLCSPFKVPGTPR